SSRGQRTAAPLAPRDAVPAPPAYPSSPPASRAGRPGAAPPLSGHAPHAITAAATAWLRVTRRRGHAPPHPAPGGSVPRPRTTPRGMDIITALAYPLPVTVIAEMLGVPVGDRQRLKRWSDEFIVYFSKSSAQVTPEGKKRKGKQEDPPR